MKKKLNGHNGAKPYSLMTAAELREATREYDEPTRGNTLPGRPLTKRQRAEFERARRGRPRIGKGAKVISLSMERSLLKRTDARAKATHITRAELVARALEALLAKKAG
jgi:hypothetical protein